MTAFLTTAWFNERTNAEFKLMLDDPKGFIDPPSRADQLAAVPEQTGSIRSARLGSEAPRRFTIDGAQMAATRTELDTLWTAFVQLCSTEEVECRFAAWPDLVGYARLQQIPVDHVSGRYVSRHFSLAFEMADPLKYARYPDLYVIANGAEVPLALGSHASFVRLKIIGLGIVGAPVIHYKNAQGSVAGSLTLGINPLVAGHWVDFDGEKLQAVRYLPVGTVAPFLWGGTVTGGVVDVPELILSTFRGSADPNDGDAVQGPSLAVVNADCVASLYKAYR